MSVTSKRAVASAIAAGTITLSTAPSLAQPPPPLAPRAQHAPAPPPAARRAYRNPDMRLAGIVLTGVAVAMGVAGASVLAWSKTVRFHDEEEVGPIIAWTTLLFGSPVVGAVGAPLWVTGARPPRAPASAAASAVPAITPGARSLDLRWTF